MYCPVQQGSPSVSISVHGQLNQELSWCSPGLVLFQISLSYLTCSQSWESQIQGKEEVIQETNIC